jgi:hypothetical protein
VAGWVRRNLPSGELDDDARAEVGDGIRLCYRAARIPQPKRIVWLPGPAVASKLIGPVAKSLLPPPDAVMWHGDSWHQALDVVEEVGRELHRSCVIPAGSVLARSNFHRRRGPRDAVAVPVTRLLQSIHAVLRRADVSDAVVVQHEWPA